MSSIGKALVVAPDGTSIIPSDLAVAHITPGTDQQTLMTNAGATAWRSKRWSYAGGSLDITGVGNNANAATNLVVPISPVLNLSGGTGVNAISGNAFSSVNATTIRANYSGYYMFLWSSTLENTDNNAGQFTSMTAWVDGIPLYGFGFSSPQVALKKIAYTNSAIVFVSVNQEIQFQCQGSAQDGVPVTGNMLLDGRINYWLMNTL